MIEEKEITIPTAAGGEKTYIISKIPAIPAREIVTQYPISGMPKLGDYKVNEAIMFKLMAYVDAVDDAGNRINLKTAALINNHVHSWEDLARLEAAMIEYNCSFFGNGKASTFFEAIKQNIPQLISKIAMDLLAQSSQKDAPASTTSSTNTP